jgi:hypothetical protein
MRDTAALAEQSDPARNAMFGRRWTGPPAQKRKAPGSDTQGSFEKLNLTDKTTTADLAGQRALFKALRHAAEIDRTADLLLALGFGRQAERLSHNAAAIREAVTGDR